MDINKRSITTAHIVPPTQRYKKALQFCKVSCSNYEWIRMTCIFIWRSWIGRGHNSYKFFQPCMDCVTPHMWNQMHQGTSNQYGYHLHTGLWRRKQHQTQLKCSSPLPGMCGHATRLQLELHMCLSPWSIGCLDYTFPLVSFSYIMLGLT
jgi:hypothetical protein